MRKQAAIAAVTPLVSQAPIAADPARRSRRLLLRIELEDGSVGLGAGPIGEPAAWRDAVRGCGSTVIGMDAWRTATVMAAATADDGAPGRHVLGALAGALHDATARSLDVPVYDLLGGRYRDVLPVIMQVDPQTPSAAAEAAAAGFGHVAVEIGDAAPVHLDRARIGAVLDEVAGIRAELAAGVRLEVVLARVDSVSGAVRLARMLESVGVSRLTLGGIGVAGMRAVREQVRLSVGLGALPDRAELRPFVEAHVADQVTVDVATLGPDATRRYVDLAAHFDSLATTAASGGIVGLLLALQVGAALPGVEAVRLDPATWRRAHSVMAAPLQLEDGALAPVEGAGIGAALGPEDVETLD